MITKVKEYMNSQKMLDQGDRVVVGVSGGADSVCLLWILHLLREELGIELEAVHVHHGLRGAEADGDREYVQSFCRDIAVPLYEICEDVRSIAKREGLSEEEAGRMIRYQSFEGVLRQTGCNKIAVAHHKDDSAETVLFHLFRGSGLKGLAGIPAVRNHIIRPLMCLTKREIEEFLTASGRTWRTDSTNLEDGYARNRIRNTILPYAREYINQQAAEHILQAAGLIGEADAYFQGIAEDFCGKYVKERQNGICAEAALIAAEPGIIQGYILRTCYHLAAGKLKDLSHAHVESLRQLLLKTTGKQISLPGGLLARRDYGWFVIEPEAVAQEVEFSLSDVVFTRISYDSAREIPKNRYTKWFDYDKIQGTLSIRCRQKGDFVLLPSGGRKSIKSYMIDQKIPRQERDSIPLLSDGSHILWIIGRRVSEGCKVTTDTKNILQVKYIGGKSGVREY